jgi:predicted component of type VI protein secretion system
MLQGLPAAIPSPVDADRLPVTELVGFGFTPLERNADISSFYHAQTVHLNSLPHLLTASRFVHFCKAMMRDKIGAFMTREQAETFLNQWLALYVGAEQPLSVGRLRVEEIPDIAGRYRTIAELRPSFQLEPLLDDLRIEFELPSGGR